MNPLDYVKMIRNGAQEVLDGTHNILVFAKSAEIAAQEIQRILNETKSQAVISKDE